jgi:Arylsulfotransferase (ASST)
MATIRALAVGAGASLGLALACTAGARAANAPACVPTRLNASALQDGVVTVSPMPGSRDAAAQTQISFLGVPASDLRAIVVSGSRSGRHRGRLLAYSRGDGGSFLPARPFAEGERVSVRAQLTLNGSARRLSYSFAIARADRVSTAPHAVHGGPAIVQRFRSRPDLRPPTVTVTQQSPGVASGDVFLAPYEGPEPAGPMILEPNGGLVWFKPLPAHTIAADLQVQRYEGKPVLTWWQGVITVNSYGVGEGVIADGGYREIARVRAGNGLHADLHELQLTPQGTALITVYHPILCDLAAAGGRAHGGVIDGALQEIDVRTGLVMYEWTSLDHVAFGESFAPVLPVDTLPATPLDYFHINSVNLDRDGSLLVSSRNTWTVYRLDQHSGRITWRLGGKRSSFKMGSGTQTAWQHDARELPDGAISIFDNGASPAVHPQARGIVVNLDSARHTATLALQVTHTPPLISESQGDLQALPNGDWFIGWGGERYFSEFDPSGRLLFDAHLPPHEQSYRALRFEWTGTPAQPPAFAFQPASAGGGTAYASWDGATLVSSWRVLAGASASSLSPVAAAPRSGFETAIAVPAWATGPYIAVQALDAAGHVLGTSRALPRPGLTA